ncbi:ORF6N domain-containing protein [Mucilaginibacter sp. AW1-7]|uniref:ORF6N domain-containing protein n=1 Tax=Mucilaginibacter sp. AW1-7 TaxID=3349874 RepID=UPI003F73AB8E
MTEKSIIADEIIMSKIYYIRDQKVMLDKDLAELYQVTTGNLNKAVARNIKRFPPDFMFRLTGEEFKNLLFQNGTASWGGTRLAPNVFSEQGVAMLSGVLTSERAIEVNIQIMRIFIKVREMFLDNTEIRMEIEKIKGKLDNHDKNIEIVFQCLDELSNRIPLVYEPPPRKRIGFKQDDL